VDVGNLLKMDDAYSKAGRRGNQQEGMQIFELELLRAVQVLTYIDDAGLK
jgi:hypothetical protein